MARLRRIAIPVVLFLAIAALAPPAWQFVSTVPESEFRADPNRTRGLERRLYTLARTMPPLPFEVDSFERRARVLRWGEDRGQRHGPFTLTDAEGRVRVEGIYRRGERSGTWRAFDAEGALILEGAFVDDRRHGRWSEPVGSRTVEVEYDSGALLRWRVFHDGSPLPWAEAPPKFEGELALHAIGRGSPLPGTFVAMGLGRFFRKPGHVTPDWVEEGTWVCFSATGQLEGFGPMRRGQPVGQWTFFAADGGIGRQELRDASGRLEEERREPPWYPAARSFALPALEAGRGDSSEASVPSAEPPPRG